MGLTLKTAAQFISNLQQSIIGSLSSNPPNQQISDFSDGSIGGAITESTGEQLTFVQSLAPQVLAVTRASTCALPDLITFVTDYFLDPPWNGPTDDVGQVIFARKQAASSSVVLLVGVIVQTPSPSPASAIQYAVIPDVTNAAYSANAGGTGIPGYTLASGLTQFAQNPLAQAVNPGTGSHVIPNSLTVIASAGVPFDTVTNPAAINNASDGETAPQLLQRFSDYIGGLSSGTRYRIAAQIQGVQAGITFTLNEFTNTDGTPRDGFSTVVADDGSGSPPGSFFTAITAAVTDPAKGKSLGAQVVPIPAIVVPITIAVNGTTIEPTFVPSDVRSAIQAALVAFVNANGVGGAPVGTGSNPPSLKLAIFGIESVVAGFIGSAAGQGLAGYASITVNGGSSDVPLTAFQLARASNGSVTVS